MNTEAKSIYSIILIVISISLGYVVGDVIDDQVIEQCKFLLSNNECLARDYWDNLESKNFATVCDSGYYMVDEPVMGSICVSNGILSVFECSDEECYIVMVTGVK